MSKYGEPSSIHYLNADEFVNNSPRASSAAALPHYAEHQVAESDMSRLNSLQRELDKHPNG